MQLFQWNQRIVFFEKKNPRFENAQIKVCSAAHMTSYIITAFTYRTSSSFILEIINILMHLRSMFSFYTNQSVLLDVFKPNKSTISKTIF